MSDDETKDARNLHIWQLRAKGLGPSSGTPAPDPSDDSKIVKRNWKKAAPAWRIAVPGLSLEGHCHNNSCRAHKGGIVIVKWGYRNKGVFDFFRNDKDVNCPICGKYVKVENFGFTDTEYKVTGCKKPKPDEPFEDVDTDWKVAPSTYYTTFLNKPEDLVYWG